MPWSPRVVSIAGFLCLRETGIFGRLPRLPASISRLGPQRTEPISSSDPASLTHIVAVVPSNPALSGGSKRAARIVDHGRYYRFFEESARRAPLPPAQSEIFTAPFEPRIAGLRFRCVQFQNRARLHNQYFCSAPTSEKHRMRFCPPPLPHALLSTVAVHFSLGTSERVIGPVFNGSERCCHGPSRNVFRLLVDLAAVSNARDTDELRRVVDDVYHAPVTDSDAPLTFVAFQFLVLHPAGRGSSASAKIFRSMRVNSGSPSASNSFCADCLISREYLSTRAGAFQAVCAVLLVRNALFLSARFRNQPV